MKFTKAIFAVIGVFFVGGIGYLVFAFLFRSEPLRTVDVFGSDTSTQQSLAFAPFNTSFQIEETGSMQESSSSVFWVSSGARLIVKDAIAQTVQGDLPTSDPWYSAYKNDNPTDTDGGSHPQNIFRLVAKNVWGDERQELYYKINKLNLSTSSNRNASNGMFMMQRYKDANNLYYTGVRVDGYVVVKKKIGGTYYTMGSTRVFDGTYNRDTNPNLLPLNQWMGFRTETVNEGSGKVIIRMYTDNDGSGNWKLVLTVTDDGNQYGGAAFTSAGYSGLRTDFADISMRAYTIDDLSVTTAPEFPVAPPVVTPGDYVDPTPPQPVLTSPTVTINTPVDGGTYSRRRSISINVKANDQGSVKSIVIKADTKTLKTCTASSVTSCSINWNARNTSLGAHTITAIATNNLSQSSTTISSITLTK